jgi:hypothetical protein
MSILLMLWSGAIRDKEPLMRLTHGQDAHATFGIPAPLEFFKGLDVGIVTY